MKLSLIVVTVIMSLNTYVAEASDVYLTRAGWSQQSGGWMDPETDLIWGPEVEKMSWGEAKSHCQSMSLGGKGNWRLPTVHELQRSVCKATNYKTRVPCPQARDHQKDLWLLIGDKETTYWAGNIIPGDPYNAYYFMIDVEGQYIITSKGDKSKARCVTEGIVPVVAEATPVIGNTAIASGEAAKKPTFYIAPMIGLGAFFTSDVSVSNYAYLNAEFRGGYSLSDKFMLFMSADTGLNIKDFSYPVLTTVTTGPEYFLTDRVSLFGAVGGGILTVNRTVFAGQSAIRDTSGGFAWKAGFTWQIIKWGDRGQHNIPISITYTGIRTSLMISHTALLSLGFMYFN